MENKILGLHHITAIAGDAQRNYDFYTKTLGFRLVKKTVNFDDPQTYHFYFGDRTGTPGTLLTFFPWKRVRPGKNGVGMATEIGYSVPTGTLDFWLERLKKHRIPHEGILERFGEKYLSFRDPDGLFLNLIESKEIDDRTGNETDEVTSEVSIKGFHTVTLTLKSIDQTAALLREVFGYQQIEKEGNRYRYKTEAVEHAALIDLMEIPGGEPGLNAGGTNHHIAFRVKDEETLLAIREKIIDRGLQITEKIDRDYFYSLYFREPGGVLFEIATDNPGFMTDENIDTLGSTLQLPDKFESIRERIEKGLPTLNP